MPTTIFNPFKNRDPKEVWEEIRRTKKPITKETAVKQMREASSKPSQK